MNLTDAIAKRVKRSADRTEAFFGRRQQLSVFWSFVPESQLCFRFNIDGSNLARKARNAGQSSQEYLEKQTGWRYEKSDRKYYPSEQDLL
jgi:hypothetical protein